MSAHAATPRRTPRRGEARRRTVRRRRLTAIAAAVLLGAGGAYLALPSVDKVVQEVALPLRHEDIIRQQAADKQLDPALIAAVIYTESRFRDQTSHAGARGLMQITPDTARFIARRSGGTRFVPRDLATPQVNIAYGSWYLRYLLDRYGGNEALALAAYNGGEGNVDRWLTEGRATVSEIPFPETRQYVGRVLGVRKDYRREYAGELGL